MKKFILITIAVCVAMFVCVGNKAFAAVPDGYKTHQLTGFSVGLPAEFEKADGWSSESNLSFNSNAVNVRDDGDEYLSSANINVYDMDGDIEEINEYAQNMVGSAKAMWSTGASSLSTRTARSPAEPSHTMAPMPSSMTVS